MTLPVPTGIGAKKIIFVGIGNDKNMGTESIRELLNSVAQQLKKDKIYQASFDLDALTSLADFSSVSRHLIEALGDSNYQYIKQPKAKNNSNLIKAFKCTILCNSQNSKHLPKKAQRLASLSIMVKLWPKTWVICLAMFAHHPIWPIKQKN